MKTKRLCAVALALAAIMSITACSDTASTDSTSQPSDSGSEQTSSGVTSSDATSSNAESTGTTPQSNWEFSQVAMGGGGFVSGVFATNEEGLYYARTDVGGAYRYDKDLGRWVSLSYWVSEDDVGLLGIDGLAFGDKDPNRLYLLAGTEYFSGGKTCLLISDNYGEDFEVVDLTTMIKAHGNGMGRGNGERIAVDPKNSDILYIGGRTGGMLKSTDGGKTFNALDMGTNTATSNGNGICSILIDPNSGDDSSCSTIYAAISRIQEDNLYKSTDGGATWTAVPDAPKGLMVQRMKMRSDGKILLTYANTEGPWNNNRSSGRLALMDPETGAQTDISPAKQTFGDVVSDPNDPNKMMVCTENIYAVQPNGSYGDEFYVTKDGGANWTKLNNVMSMSDGGIEWINTAAIHWCSSMCIDPNDPDKIQVVSGNGIFACDNIWDEKPEFYFNSKGIEETVPFELVSVPGGPLVTAIGDYDGFSQPDAETYGTVHSSVAGSMQSIAVAANATDIWAKCGGDSSTPGFWYTEDAGKTWTNVKSSPVEGSNISYGGCVAVSCDGKTMYWAPTNGTAVYYTTDKGKTWTASTGALSVQKITCDPVNPDYVYASSTGSFYYSEDGGKTFKVNNTLSVFSLVKPIVEPGKEGKVYYAAMGLQVSEDHGKTFTRVENVAACLSLGLGSGKNDGDPCTIFIWGKPAKDDVIGLYWSKDEGKTWERITDEQHQFGGTGNGGFVYGDFNVYGRVYMSTVGLGVVYGDVVE